MTVHEPEWSEQDRAWIQALLALESGRCPGCGGDLEETTRADQDEGYDIQHVECKRCRFLEQERTRYHEAHKDKDGRSDVHNHIWTAALVRRGN